VEKTHHLSAADVAELRQGEPAGAILALACSSATEAIADIFRASGFKSYIGHVGYNQIDSMLLYCATFYCALRSCIRDDETKDHTIEEAHDLATRVQDFRNGTRGYRIFEIQP